MALSKIDQQRMNEIRKLLSCTSGDEYKKLMLEYTKLWAKRLDGVE